MSNCRSGATYFIGLLAHCVMVSIVEVALFIGIGRLYGVPMPTHWAAILMTLVLGAASFCALGVAVASLIRNAEAAPAVVQFVLFPAGLHLRHLLSYPLRCVEPHRRRTAGPPVQ